MDELKGYESHLQPVGIFEEAFRRYMLPELAGFRVLDVGCGQGTYLQHLPHGSVGVDLSAVNAEACRQRGLECHVMSDPHKLPFESGAFPGILMSHVLEHVPGPVMLLRDAWRVLQDGGTLVLGLPIEGALVKSRRSYYDSHPGHLYSFSEVNADRLLRTCGFRPWRLRYWLKGINRLGLGFLLPILHLLPKRILSSISHGFWLSAKKSPLLEAER